MGELKIFNTRFNALVRAGRKQQGVFLTDVRREYRQDLLNFIAGETLASQDGKLLIGRNLYHRWLKKITFKGFDYDIKLRK